MLTKRYIELVILFVVVPMLLALPIYLVPILIIGALGLFYVILVALKIKEPRQKTILKINWSRLKKVVLFRFAVIVLTTVILMRIQSPENLFNPPLQKPGMWLGVMLVYSICSVLPQELLYRSFFFYRYKILFPSTTLLIVVNAVLFSLAHLFFGSILVLVITFIGGLIFAYTYYKTNSIVLVSIEHALYGVWLFTVGMGPMLGFPI